MPKGLRGLPGLNMLSDAERQAFMLNNEDKLKAYARNPRLRKQAAEVLYNNQQFINQFGQDAFDQMNDGTEDSYNLRNNYLREKVIDDAFKSAYSPFDERGNRDNNKGFGESWETYYNDLSTDAKEKLLKSDWQTPEQLKAKEGDVTGIGFLDTAIDFVAGEAINQHRRDANQKILDRIYNDDAESASSRLGSVVSQAYFNPAITGRSDEETKKMFIQAITPSRNSMGISEYASHYGNGSDEDITSEMEDFTIDDMRQVLAKKAVYEQYMSPQMASTALNNEAKRYIKDHQGSLKRFGLFAKDVGISALSYTADKVNGIYNLGLAAADKLSDWGVNAEKPTVYVDTQGNVIDPKNVVRNKRGEFMTKGENGKYRYVHQEQIDRTTLHNMGRNLDGSEDNSILNAQYWTRAEQFGTLDEDEQKQYEKLGSSPYKVAYNPNEESDLWYESFKMMSFGLADAASMLIPFGVGMVGRGLSTASKAGKVVNGLGKGLDKASKYLTYSTRTGQVLQGGAGALGIAYAYNRGAFQETLAQNLANAEQANINRSKQEIYNQYQNDEQYKGQIDSLVDARAAQMKADYVAQATQDGSQVIDSPELDNMIRSRAQEAVLGELVQQRAEERKGTQEYADLQQEAINSAGDAAVRSFLPEAIKYGLVNTLGYRKFLYTNPAGLSKKMSATFKGMEEVTTSAGKKRLVAGASKFETLGGKAKQFGKVAAAQMWGGAWTNGTDDMMVDAAERTANDSFQQYLNAYESGESIADTYGLVDGLYSYWKGLQNSLGQETTWNAALVGGLGSVVSASPNMANIAHLASKEGREAFRNNFQKRYVYETDENGFKQIKRDEQGNPVTEYVSLEENWRERANYFIQNGVLNTYYGKKQAERDLQGHADYVNKFLDEQNDFDELDDLVTSDIIHDNVDNVADKKTAKFIHAFNAIKALETLGKSKNDPLAMSSVVQGHKDFINRAAKLGTEEEHDFSDEELTKLASQYYSNNAIPESEQNTEDALRHIGENARKLQEVQQAYDEAEIHIQNMERSIGAPLNPMVRGRLKLSKALNGHWKERISTMKDEIGDTSDAENRTTGLELVLSYGSKKKAEQAIKAFDTIESQQKEKKNEILAEVQKKLEVYNQAQQAVRDAKNSDERYIAQTSLKLAEASYNEAMERKMYQDDIISSLQEKKQQLQEGLNAWEKGSTRVLTANEIFALDPNTRARMMDPKMRNIYNDKQKKEIEKLEKRLRQDKGEDSLQKIQDISTLTQNVAQNEDAYNRISRNPDAAALQFENQKKKAADAAYQLITKRNAQTLADMVQQAEDGLKHHNNVSKDDIDQMVFRMLRKHSPTLLDLIEENELLPQYQKQLNEAKEWSKVTSDIDAVISAMDVEDKIKDSIYKNIDDIVEKANSRAEIIQNLEDAVDNVGDADIASDFDRVLQGLEKLGYQRDATVVEDRKQRKAREKAARKKLEEDKARLEAEAKAATEKAAQEAAEKAKVKAEEEKKVAAEAPKATGPLKDLDLGEDTSVKAAEEVKSADSEKEFNERLSKLKDDVAKNTRTGMRGWTNVTVVNKDYNGAPHINIGTYNSGEDWQTSSDYRLNEKGQVEAKFEDKDWQVIEHPSDYIKEFFDGFRKTAAEPAETVAKEEVLQRKVKMDPKYHESAKKYLDDKTSSWKYYTDDDSNVQENTGNITGHFINGTLQPAINYAVAAGVLGEEYKLPDTIQNTSKELSDKIRKATKELYSLGIRNPKQLIEYIENNVGKEIGISTETSQQKEESSVTNDMTSEEEALKREWFGTGNPSEVEMREEGDSYVAESPTIEEEVKAVPTDEGVVKDTEQLEDSDTTNEQGQDAIDTKEDTLSGNAMAEYVTDLLKRHTLKRKQGNRGIRDSMNNYFAWMDAEGIKLQDIIDDELHQIIEAYADEEKPLKLKFMAVRRDNNATHDNYMQNHLMLVVDFDGIVKGIHQEGRGGVISVKDKKYLVIGVVGYGKDNAQNAERKRLRDVLFSPNRGTGYGIAIEGMGDFFKNNPSERFFVRDEITTEIVPGSLVPGYLVKQLKSDDTSSYRTIGDLLGDAERNPHGLTMKDLGWYLQELTKYITVNAKGRKIMQPWNEEGNAGRAFVLVPASNGKLIPAYIKTITYPEMVSDERFANSALRGRIDRAIDALISPPSKENLAQKKKALTELMQILYLNKDHNFILMTKDGSKISLVKDGENRRSFAQFNLNDAGFTKEKFMDAFNEMNPHINITPSVLNNSTVLQEYDEAGALQTDLGRLYAAGASYSIYPVDLKGKMMVPENVENSVTWNRGSSKYRGGDRAQVAYRGKYYFYDGNTNTFHESENSPAITDADLLEELKYNMQVMSLSPTEQTTKNNIYVLKEGERPEIVVENRSSHEIKKMSEEEAIAYLAEQERKKDAEARAKAVEEANKKEIEERPALDLGIDENTGEIISQEKQPEKKGKIEVVEEPPANEHRSRESYADKSVEGSTKYKPTSATQTFKQLSKNKKYKSQLFEMLSKMENSPVKFNDKGKLAPIKTEDIEAFLSSKGIPLDNIGTSDADINAWIHTLECH